MTILLVITAIAFVVAPLAGWAVLIMWLAARSDRKFREREILQGVFGEGKR